MQFDSIVHVAAVLGDRTCVRVLLMLGDRPLTIGALANVLGIAQSSTSFQLRRLAEVGLVRVVRRGRRSVVQRDYRRWARVVEAFGVPASP